MEIILDHLTPMIGVKITTLWKHWCNQLSAFLHYQKSGPSSLQGAIFFEGVKKIGVCILYTILFPTQCKHLLSYLIVFDILKTYPQKNPLLRRLCLDESRILLTHHLHPPRFNNSLLKKMMAGKTIHFPFGIYDHFSGKKTDSLFCFVKLPGG